MLVKYSQEIDTISFSRDFGSLANLIKSAAGTGLFAMPNAFACVGLFFGIIGVALMGLLITGSLQLLVRIHHLMCTRLKKPVLVYDEVVVATLTTDVRKPWLSPRTAMFVISLLSNRIISRFRHNKNVYATITRYFLILELDILLYIFLISKIDR